MGAAVDALGSFDEYYSQLYGWDSKDVNQYIDARISTPILRRMALDPIDRETYTVASIIVSLNDNAMWTREEIADWVESVEKNILDNGIRCAILQESRIEICNQRCFM